MIKQDPLVSHVNVNSINSAKIKEEKEEVIDLECQGDIDTVACNIEEEKEDVNDLECQGDIDAVACNIDANSREKFVQDLAVSFKHIYKILLKQK